MGQISDIVFFDFAQVWRILAMIGRSLLKCRLNDLNFFFDTHIYLLVENSNFMNFSEIFDKDCATESHLVGEANAQPTISRAYL